LTYERTDISLFGYWFGNKSVPIQGRNSVRTPAGSFHYSGMDQHWKTKQLYNKNLQETFPVFFGECENID
jgi:hypothetical protein